jgi:TM2 domain-containing membrane protein YozV
MKNILLTFLAVVALASCSAPKYAYYFDNHDYQAGKRKKQAPVNEVTRVTPEEIMQAVQAVSQGAEPIAIASAGKEFYPSMSTVKATDNTTPFKVSKKDKHDLKRQMKSAIKDYKKQNHEGSQAAGGDKNQLVALLLAIFLGFLGIHRFYIGRVGTAIAQLLLLILGLILLIPLYALAVWVLIDIILIAMGNLVPKNGSYNPKL